MKITKISRGRIFSRVSPSYEWAVSNLDRPMLKTLWVYVTVSLFIRVSHTTKNTASGFAPHSRKTYKFFTTEDDDQAESQPLNNNQVDDQGPMLLNFLRP
jgi:hypothetical protein